MRSRGILANFVNDEIDMIFLNVGLLTRDYLLLVKEISEIYQVLEVLIFDESTQGFRKIFEIKQLKGGKDIG